MKFDYRWWGVALGLVMVAGLLWAVHAKPAESSPEESLQFMRPGSVYSHQTISVTNSSAASTELLQQSVYRLVCNIDVHYDMGPSTVAATTSEALLPAYTVEYIRARVGYVYLAAIRGGGTNGTCYLSELR